MTLVNMLVDAPPVALLEHILTGTAPLLSFSLRIIIELNSDLCR